MTGSLVTLDELARVLGGEVSADQVNAPGPGHSEVDRSLSVRPRNDWPGFTVHSHAGDDWRECQAYVIDCLGFEPEEIVAAHAYRTATRAERIERARRIWEQGVDPRGTVVERYLASRAIAMPSWAAGRILRFHGACPWRDDATGSTIYVPAMIAGMGSLETRELTGIHRKRLSPAGEKIDRRMLGVSAGSAIPLDVLGDATDLVIGEGIETCLSGSQLGFRPVWAVASAGAVASFPVLHGITRLTILAELDEASERAVEACRDRWRAAGRNVASVLPIIGKDFNDSLVELNRVGRLRPPREADQVWQRGGAVQRRPGEA